MSVEHATASAQASAAPSPVARRKVRLGYRDNQPDDNSGCNACQTQKKTQNYLNANVGSDTAFLADDKVAAAASNAPTPSGYAKVFTNLKAASNGYVCKFDFFNHSPFILNPCNLRYFKWVLPPLTVSWLTINWHFASFQIWDMKCWIPPMSIIPPAVRTNAILFLAALLSISVRYRLMIDFTWHNSNPQISRRAKSYCRRLQLNLPESTSICKRQMFLLGRCSYSRQCSKRWPMEK